MLSRFEEETRERLAELEQRLAALEGGHDVRTARGHQTVEWNTRKLCAEFDTARVARVTDAGRNRA